MKYAREIVGALTQIRIQSEAVISFMERATSEIGHLTVSPDDGGALDAAVGKTVTVMNDAVSIVTQIGENASTIRDAINEALAGLRAAENKAQGK